MTDRDFTEMANSFDKAADVYERARPSYPTEAVDWLLASDPRSVLDVGAGTGKFTRLLDGRVDELFAVDPSERMLDQLRENVPSAVASVGTAEHIPLPDDSVDAVFAAQAWHWVDQAIALPEVKRVLKPGGVLGLIWNARDERVPWVKRLTDVMHNSKAELYLQDPEIAIPMDRAEFTWQKPFDRPELLELVASRSYFITADDEEKTRVLTAVEHLLDTDPELDWIMPYRTVAFRTTLG